ncbi:unnamed protein product [Plutella xylostella]|uniref:(diamondback moth) hypothetical protein n=1 Tax=Plutella xylostella TaxID=51655 RepID=A0A8S4CY33_PLUXY|nr:unnamed protein product [Plutella xylostella]
MSSTTSLDGKRLTLSTLLETDHYESLIKELTCTKCKKYMKPPLHLCVDGHSICGLCFEKSYQCHVCKKELSPIRPLVLESLAHKVLFPCTNAGCPRHATLPQLEKHAANCQFRIINCFMARVYAKRVISKAAERRSDIGLAREAICVALARAPVDWGPVPRPSAAAHPHRLHAPRTPGVVARVVMGVASASDGTWRAATVLLRSYWRTQWQFIDD